MECVITKHEKNVILEPVILEGQSPDRISDGIQTIYVKCFFQRHSRKGENLCTVLLIDVRLREHDKKVPDINQRPPL